jgi:hypothetical protein
MPKRRKCALTTSKNTSFLGIKKRKDQFCYLKVLTNFEAKSTGMRDLLRAENI